MRSDNVERPPYPHGRKRRLDPAVGLLGLLIHPFDFLYNCRYHVGCPAHLAAQRIGSGLLFLRNSARRLQDVKSCGVASCLLDPSVVTRAPSMCDRRPFRAKSHTEA
jgi:hypothetical protein